MPNAARLATHRIKRPSAILAGELTHKDSSMLLIEDNFGTDTECTAIINKKSSVIGKSQSNIASYELLPIDKLKMTDSQRRINLEDSIQN